MMNSYKIKIQDTLSLKKKNHLSRILKSNF